MDGRNQKGMKESVYDKASCRNEAGSFITAAITRLAIIACARMTFLTCERPRC